MHLERQFQLLDAKFLCDEIGQLLQGAERAEPAAEKAAVPHQRTESGGAPEDENHRVHQKDVPVKTVNERIGKRQHIDHRQLPVHRKLRAKITAEPEEGESQVADAECLVSARVAGNPFLQHKDADQHENGNAEDDDLHRFVLPCLARNLLLHTEFARIIGSASRAIIGGNRCRLRRRGRRLNIIRVGNLLQISGGQAVIHIVSNERLFPRSGGALHQQLQLPRTRHIQRLLLRHHKQRDFRETRRALGENIAKAAVIAVAEVKTAAILFELQAVKNSAAHITRTLERIKPFTGDENRLLVRFQLLLQLLITGIAEQTAAN